MFKFDMDSTSVDEIKSNASDMAEEVLLRFVSMREQLLSKETK